MISLDMPTFRLVVALVAEFRSLIILIHNIYTLLGEIINSTRTTRNIVPLAIPQLVVIYFHIQTFNFRDFMILWLPSYASSREEDSKKMENMAKINVKITILHVYLTSPINQFCIPVVFMCSLPCKLRGKHYKPDIWLSMGID